MFSRNRDEHHESGTTGGMIRWFTASSLCCFKGTSPQPEPVGDGVSTNLALIFGTLLSSQGTDASFALTRETLSGFPPGFSLRSCVSDSIRPFPDPISSVLSRFPLSRFPFRRFRLYQILSGLIPSQRGLSSRPLGRSDVPNFSGSSRQFLIGPPRPERIEFGHAEFTRLGDHAGGWGAASAAEVLPQN